MGRGFDIPWVRGLNRFKRSAKTEYDPSKMSDHCLSFAHICISISAFRGILVLNDV